jgi:gliding motility-associated-like protein
MKRVPNIAFSGKPRLPLIIFALLTCLMGCLQNPLLAQTPCFNILGERAQCVPAKIAVRNCVVGTNVYYVPDSTNPINIINGTPGVDTIRYTKPGKYRLGQGILVGGSNRYLYQTIYVIANRTPVPEAIACDNFLVTVSIPKVEGERFIINYQDGYKDTTISSAEPVAISQHRYNGFSPNPARIVVKSFYNCGKDTTIAVRLKTALLGPDSIKVDQSVADSLTVKLSTKEKFVFEVERLVGGTYLPENFTLRARDQIVIPIVPNQLECYRLSLKDNCGTLIAVFPFCNATTKAVSFNNYNQITYKVVFTNGVSTPLGFTINRFRNGSIFSTNSVNRNTLQGGIVMIDTNVTSPKNYCYAYSFSYAQIYNTNQRVVISITSSRGCTSAISNRIPPRLRSLTTSKVGYSTQLHWKSPPDYLVKQYIIRKYIGNDRLPTWEQTLVDTFATDAEVEGFENRFFYTVQYIDSCGNLSRESEKVNTVLLSTRRVTSIFSGLTWNLVKGWDPKPISYNIDVLNQYDEIIGRIVVGKDSVRSSIKQRFEGSQRIRCRVRIVPNGLVQDTAYSNAEEIVQQSDLIMPNAFSPNFDKVNDLYLVQASFLIDYKIKIIDRWGLLVYESDDPNQGWDGMVNGNRAPLDVYVAIVTAKDQLGASISQTQMVNLIR